MTVELIRRLEELDAADRVLAGGKGANLGAMLRAGLPVPPGFAVLTPAYRAFVERNGIRAEIERLQGGPGVEVDADVVGETTQEI